jgi:hypothetical protein
VKNTPLMAGLSLKISKKLEDFPLQSYFIGAAPISKHPVVRNFVSGRQEELLP